jgi:hypothetical protein
MVLFIIFVVGSVVFEYAITCCGRVMIDFMKTESLGDVLTQPLFPVFRIDHRGRTEVEPLYNILFANQFGMRDHRRLEIFQIVYNHINISHNRLRGRRKKTSGELGFVEGEYPVNVFTFFIYLGKSPRTRFGIVGLNFL